VTAAAGRRQPRFAVIAGTLLAVLGLGGLAVGAWDGDPGAGQPVASGTTQRGVTVFGLYIRETSAPSAPVFFSVRNDSGAPVRFEKAYSGASWGTRLHAHPGSPEPQDLARSAPIPIPDGSVTQLGPQQPHLMLEDVIAPLAAGDQVTLTLYFAGAGQFLVRAPVIAADAPVPVDTPS